MTPPVPPRRRAALAAGGSKLGGWEGISRSSAQGRPCRRAIHGGARGSPNVLSAVRPSRGDGWTLPLRSPLRSPWRPAQRRSVAGPTTRSAKASSSSPSRARIGVAPADTPSSSTLPRTRRRGTTRASKAPAFDIRISIRDLSTHRPQVLSSRYYRLLGVFSARYGSSAATLHSPSCRPPNPDGDTAKPAARCPGLMPVARLGAGMRTFARGWSTARPPSFIPPAERVGAAGKERPTDTATRQQLRRGAFSPALQARRLGRFCTKPHLATDAEFSRDTRWHAESVESADMRQRPRVAQERGVYDQPRQVAQPSLLVVILILVPVHIASFKLFDKRRSKPCSDAVRDCDTGSRVGGYRLGVGES